MGQFTGPLYLGTVPMARRCPLSSRPYLGRLLGLSPAWLTGMAGGLLLLSVVLNVFSVERSGRVALAAALVIASILLAAVATSVPHVVLDAFSPWLPHGWLPVGEGAALLFGALVGWDMLAHMAEEFYNPERDVMRAMVVAIIVIDVLYLAVATVTAGTHM